PRGAEAFLRAQMAGYRRRGWFDPANYRADSGPLRAFVDVVMRARAQGTRPAIVLMPEGPAVLGAVPLEAEREMREALRNLPSGSRPAGGDPRRAEPRPP